jgi:hypothetical protein
VDYAAILLDVARDLDALKPEFPQLKDYSPADHARADQLEISYSFRTHRPTHRGGWTSGVPNPDPDGVWFHLDFHDPDSQAQIHTQPVVPTGRLGKKVVMLLLLEGSATKPLGGRIWKILEARGVARAGL